MKIINIMQGTDLGGMEQASLRLMLGLKELGHSLEVLSLNPIGSLGHLLQKHSIPARGLRYLGKGGWRSYLPLKRELHRVKADALLMTGHHLLAMIAMSNLCAGSRVLAVHFHHSGVKPEGQWRLIYRLACRRFRAITFSSDFIRNEAEALYPPVASLSFTVRNPVSIPPLPSEEDRSKARRLLGLPEDALVIGNAGWLIRRKRFDVFVQVAQKVVKDVPNALFLIAGDGEERLRLEALAKQLSVAHRIKWLGWQIDLAPFYQCLDVMLFNSDWDAMGLSPLEAAAYGVPLVASVQQGGLKEIINKEDYGFLIPTHDVDALARKTIYFLRNPDEARKVALAGRHRVETISNTQQHALRMESLIQGTALSEIGL
jgi:glycosyltransferase involved in cell wall biosynthesis